MGYGGGKQSLFSPYPFVRWLQPRDMTSVNVTRSARWDASRGRRRPRGSPFLAFAGVLRLPSAPIPAAWGRTGSRSCFLGPLPGLYPCSRAQVAYAPANRASAGAFWCDLVTESSAALGNGISRHRLLRPLGHRSGRPAVRRSRPPRDRLRRPAQRLPHHNKR